MTDHAELQGKLLAFLMAEWARKDNRQLVQVDLCFSPGGGFKDEEIRSWVRTDEPELFAEFTHLEKLVMQIIEIAVGEADSKPAGKHRFFVRCRQHGGSRPTQSFALYPSYTGGDDTSIVPSGGGGGGGGRDQQVIAGHAGQLMRINAQMFEGTIRVLGQQNSSLHQQVMQLSADNATLRRDLEAARSDKDDREFQMMLQMEKAQRTKAGFDKLLQIGTVVAAKIGMGGDDNNQQSSSSSSLGMLIGAFYTSLRPEQTAALMQLMPLLDMSQKMMVGEIVTMVRAMEQQKPPGPAPGAPNGVPNGAPPR